MGHSISSDLAKNAQALADKAGPAVDKAIDRVRSMGQQGMDAVGDAAQQAREAAAYASDSIIKYTRKNPVKALLIAAASGALVLSLLNVLKARRD